MTKIYGGWSLTGVFLTTVCCVVAPLGFGCGTEGLNGQGRCECRGRHSEHSGLPGWWRDDSPGNRYGR